mmetsp:Transcript_20879/g.49406  ORF Transcript_20879/g.49406 Transcript_20879/m.49406 type:complete len:118 (+) Transcript_20879:40-393(+)|eukprot:CAMPEP_0168749416 /NCGR_PEP_ID=MMETSP0724-20121128/16704_1 /TAXON_ID=265536 /ORGANISM="Amphiprora sp., Strain CCMP467" /LENGTH=117 /DNA_ID=CAMNT_0008797323 /DNA_START=49 /DNA_END=402 /DNA_ORIENTATION=-
MTITRATWNGIVVAESDDVIDLQTITYFPRESVNMEYFVKTDKTTRCSQKGTASWYTIHGNGKQSKNTAWSYEKPTWAFKVLENRVAFFGTVKITKVDPKTGNNIPWWKQILPIASK